jgi:hypothetical protein
MRSVLRWHRPLMVFAIAMVALIAVCAVGLVVDQRILVGAPVWLKPFKFAVSFTLYTITLAWIISLLPASRPKLRRIGWWSGTAIVVLSSGEWVILLTQVIRGRMSHFNYATVLDGAFYNAMGFMVAFVWVATLVIAILVMIAKPGSRSTAWALRLGLSLSVIGMALGELMNLPTPDQQRILDAGGQPPTIGGHSVGVPDGGPGMPITDWSATGGDLRIPHFVGMHALQALPLFAILLTVLAGRWLLLRDEKVRTGLVMVAAAGYAGVVALVTWQALRGQSLIHPDVLTLAALAALIAVVTALGLAVLAAGRRRIRAELDQLTATRELAMSR